MNINFPAVDESFIKGMVDGGYYSNATDVVRDAVRRLRQEEEHKRSRLLEALEIGERAIREGRTTSYTAKLLDEIEQDARKHAAEGGKPSPEICP